LKVKILARVCNGTPYTFAGNEFSYQLLDVNNNVVRSWSNPSGASLVENTFVIDVPFGTYRLRAVKLTNSSLVMSASIIADFLVPKSYSNPELLQSKSGGGLRIKRIINSDEGNNSPNQVKEFVYSTPYTFNGQVYQRSNGLLMNYVNYHRKIYDLVSSEFALERSAHSLVPFSSSAQGQAVGYSEVTVLEGTNGINGKSVFSYWNIADIYINHAFRAPGVPSFPSEVRNGYLRWQEDYKKEAAGAYTLVRRTASEYLVSHRTILKNVIIEPSAAACNQGCLIPTMHYYPIISSVVRPSQSTTRLYSQSNPSLFTETITDYAYESNKHLQPTKTTTTNSLGEQEVTKLVYPLDYGTIPAGATGPLAGIKRLQDLNIVAPVIEQYAEKRDA
jgi:hypothetical protein